MAGGYMAFGPTFNSTPFVRLGYEGLLGSKPLSATLIAEAQENEAAQLNGGTSVVNVPLAGKIAALDANGDLVLAGSATAVAPIGLFREDLGDMVNASQMGTYYFGFGEYYVAQSRLSANYTSPQVGDFLGYDATGSLIKLGSTGDVSGLTGHGVGIVTFVGEYPAGNMYANAGEAANGGQFVGFILKL